MPARLAEVVRAFGVQPDRIRRIGARANTHWRVASGREVFFLRRYRDGPFADASAAWEADLVSDLAALGQPVPRLVAPPRRMDGAPWVLMRHVEGRKLASGPVDDGAYRWLGRQLAGLHADLERLAIRPQRPGWNAFVDSALPRAGGKPWRETLLADLRAADAEMCRAFEAALERFEARALPAVFAGAPRHAIHSDFSPWNVLVRGGRLSGVLDFELAHLDVLAADLAFARRGYHDAVVDGYVEIRPLPEAHLAALDALWLGSLLFSVWLTVDGWRRLGEPTPGQLAWNIEQLAKTRPYRGG